MRPGIIVQHARLPARSTETVRGDIAGIIGFIPEGRWPRGARQGEFLELVLRRKADLFNHPDHRLIDPASTRAVESFFENGGDLAHLFAVCISSVNDLRSAPAAAGVLTPLMDRLRDEEDIGLLLCPGAAYMRFSMDGDGSVAADVDALYDALLAHCQEMGSRFLVMDTPAGLHGPALLRWVSGFRQRNLATRAYGAMYYPWLMHGADVFPPSGTVAGSFAASEIAHGPFGVVQPPANRPLLGVTHPEIELEWGESTALTEQHINPISVQVGRGALVLGARTLSHDARFKHINSRRIMSMVSDQLRRDTDWAVFETHNPELWNVLSRNIRNRLQQYWESGALLMSRDGQPYGVLCDESLNPPESRDMGQVHVQVWVQPVGTTEQILVDLQVGNRPTIGGA